MLTRTWWTKLVVLVGFSVVSAIYITPTVFGLDPETTRFPFKQKVNLGLDLQGGLYLVLGVDFNKTYRETLERQVQSLSERLSEKGIKLTKAEVIREGAVVEDPHHRIEFDAASREAIHELLKSEYSSLRLVRDEANRFDLGLSREYRVETRERTVGQSIEVIRNRIDEFGVSEPVIASKGSDRIVVELPGVKDINRAKELIGRTAKLEFRMVDDKGEQTLPGGLPALLAQLQKDKGLEFKPGAQLSEFVRSVNEAARGKLPANTEIAFERQVAMPGSTETAGLTPYLLKSRADVTGEDLQDAQVTFNQENRAPEVAFSLNPKGAQLFGKLTQEHIGQRLAIVLDGIVHSAPVINSPIPNGRGVITLGRSTGDELMREAKDLAIVLRAGALPAQLEFLEQRSVGPSLGQDSVRSGALAGIVGCLMVFVFMIFYYRWSGAVAVFSLILNGLFCLAILIGMDATLTLPGMAGIALTIGMAVDSNVIIFERIRDELREGKPVAAAISAGFDKAFTAIFDANITHGIVAAVLMSYGTGPIRGFAVTLMIGIFTTLFCAVTVCKLVFDGYIAFNRGRLERLSI